MPARSVPAPPVLPARGASITPGRAPPPPPPARPVSSAPSRVAPTPPPRRMPGGYGGFSTPSPPPPPLLPVRPRAASASESRPIQTGLPARRSVAPPPPPAPVPPPRPRIASQNAASHVLPPTSAPPPPPPPALPSGRRAVSTFISVTNGDAGPPVPSRKSMSVSAISLFYIYSRKALAKLLHHPPMSGRISSPQTFPNLECSRGVCGNMQAGGRVGVILI